MGSTFEGVMDEVTRAARVQSNQIQSKPSLSVGLGRGGGSIYLWTQSCTPIGVFGLWALGGSPIGLVLNDLDGKHKMGLHHMVVNHIFLVPFIIEA